MLWAFWHLPFVVTGEDIWVDALLFPIEWSIVYTWLFNNAKGSVLIVIAVSMPSTVNLCGGPALRRRLDTRVRR